MGRSKKVVKPLKASTPANAAAAKKSAGGKPAAPAPAAKGKPAAAKANKGGKGAAAPAKKQTTKQTKKQQQEEEEEEEEASGTESSDDADSERGDDEEEESDDEFEDQGSSSEDDDADEGAEDDEEELTEAEKKTRRFAVDREKEIQRMRQDGTLDVASHLHIDDLSSDDEVCVRSSSCLQRKYSVGRGRLIHARLLCTSWRPASYSEQENVNTIGNVPLRWYEDYDHIGYDVDGKKIIKSNAAGDGIDNAIAAKDDPDYEYVLYAMLVFMMRCLIRTNG